MVKTALMCLALNVYHEARGESDVGQKAIAHVTLNRAEHESNICPTVYEKGQFSWTKHKKNKKVDKDSQDWKRAFEIAKQVLNHKTHDPTHGATHFHHPKVKPNWRKTLKKTTKIGNHVFYK